MDPNVAWKELLEALNKPDASQDDYELVWDRCEALLDWHDRDGFMPEFAEKHWTRRQYRIFLVSLSNFNPLW